MALDYIFNLLTLLFKTIMGNEKSSTSIENKGKFLLGKKTINRYHLIAFFISQLKLNI